MSKPIFSERIGRSWLDVDYDGKRISFAYPPFQGTHQESYKAINADSEIVPAEGFELSLLTQGAFFGNSKLWQDVRGRCIIRNYVRIPRILTWIPSKKELTGVFIERDLQGRGLSTEMVIPDNINGWKLQNRIYVNDDGMIFVPRGSYKLGEHSSDSFVKDGFATALLTEEGAEIFARTAYDNNLVPFNYGVDISQIHLPRQSVAVLGSDGYGLDLYGYLLGYDGGVSYSFGVAKNLHRKPRLKQNLFI